MPESGKAVDIHDAIANTCQKMNLDLQKSCIAAAADGASVNFGKDNGVLPLLARHQDMPWLIKIHCIAHRLELALKDAFAESFYQQEVTYYISFKILLHTL